VLFVEVVVVGFVVGGDPGGPPVAGEAPCPVAGVPGGVLVVVTAFAGGGFWWHVDSVGGEVAVGVGEHGGAFDVAEGAAEGAVGEVPVALGDRGEVDHGRVFILGWPHSLQGGCFFAGVSFLEGFFAVCFFGLGRVPALTWAWAFFFALMVAFLMARARGLLQHGMSVTHLVVAALDRALVCVDGLPPVVTCRDHLPSLVAVDRGFVSTDSFR
jgi:hypothetical protein